MKAFFLAHGQELVSLTWEHIQVSALGLGLGILAAVPLGILLTRTPRLARIVLAIASVLQTVPTLALLALMIPLFGIGKLPAVLALFIYSLLPILRNTYLGFSEIDPAVLDAAKGVGMSQWQSIWRVEFPLALPVVLSGIRLSAVYVLAWATLASYIGGGGLGEMIFSGLNLYKPELIIGGTVPVTLLALLTDFLLGRLEEALSPRTLSKEVG